MALIESGRMSRDILPPINHPDFEKSRPEKRQPSRFSIMPGLSISTAPLASPNTLYSGPPPPYSCASSTTESVHGMSGYFSPPQPTSRRLTWDEKNPSSAKILPSLPSLHEALGSDKPMSFPGPTAVTQTTAPGTAPATVFPEAPRGPSNPFSQPTAPPPLPSGHAQSETFTLPKTAATTTPRLGPEPPLQLSQPYSSSPRANNNTHRPSIGSISSTTRPFEPPTSNVPFPADPDTLNSSFRDYRPQPPAPQSHPPSSFNFEPTNKFDDSRNPFVRSNPTMSSYGETVKRHLEVFDAEMALNEIAEASNRTYDFSRSWAQRHHQGHRSSYLAESAPSVQEIDETMRQQQQILNNLNRLREYVVVQQNLLSEQRARAARGHMEDDYSALHDEYKTGGFAGGDAKKRRGKAAPPGRCHSCNRAETPEWRRGPDGARTLCNACGLHYAKLTRKLGANKASALTGSNLRPKGLDPRPTHV